jgi:hypothetical protein
MNPMEQTAWHVPEPAPAGLQTPADRVRQSFRSAREIYAGIFFAPYGRAIQREILRERDAFLLLTLSDLLGVPNPVQYYTLELYPELLEEMHEWHTRLGMPRAPEDGWRCC